MGLFNFLREKEDKKLLMKTPVFKENYGWWMHLVGTYGGTVGPWINVLWLVVHLAILYYTCYYSIAIDFDLGVFSATAHYILMISSVATSLVNSQINTRHFEFMVKQMNMGFYKYGDTIDPETAEDIEKEKKIMKDRKGKVSKIIFWMFMCAAVVSMAVFPIIFKVPDKGRNDPYFHRYVHKNRFGTEVTDTKSYEFQECVAMCLKDSIRHHYIAIEYFYHLKMLFYYLLLVIMLGSTFLLCISGIVFVSDEVEMKPKMQSFCYLVVVILHTLNFAWYGEIIKEKSLNLRTALYEAEWVECSSLVNKYLIILASYTGQPIVLTAGGFMEANLNTFSNVLSSSYSYFNLLSVMMGRE